MNFVKITDLFYYINDGTHDTPIYTETGIPFIVSKMSHQILVVNQSLFLMN